jgi:DNA-binding transcriptional ArsR family regulator
LYKVANGPFIDRDSSRRGTRYRVLGAIPARVETLRLTLASGEISATELMDALKLTRNSFGRHGQ